MQFIILDNSIACLVNEGKNGCWGKNIKIEDVRKTIGEGEKYYGCGEGAGMSSGEKWKMGKKELVGGMVKLSRWGKMMIKKGKKSLSGLKMHQERFKNQKFS